MALDRLRLALIYLWGRLRSRSVTGRLLSAALGHMTPGKHPRFTSKCTTAETFVTPDRLIISTWLTRLTGPSSVTEAPRRQQNFAAHESLDCELQMFTNSLSEGN